jgi:hypothetical protein
LEKSVDELMRYDMKKKKNRFLKKVIRQAASAVQTKAVVKMVRG